MPALRKSRARSGRRDHRYRGLHLQPLEDRRLLAVDSLFDRGVLTIKSDAADAIALSSQSGLAKINGAVPSTGVVDASTVHTIHVRPVAETQFIDFSNFDRSAFSAVEYLVFANGPWVDPSETLDVINETLGPGWEEALGITDPKEFLVNGDWREPLANGTLAAQLTSAGWGNAHSLLNHIVTESGRRAVIRSVRLASAADLDVDVLYNGRLELPFKKGSVEPVAEPLSASGDEGDDPTLFVWDAVVTEPASPQDTVEVLIPISIDEGDDHQGVDLDWTLSDVTATHPADYDSAENPGTLTGSLHFAPGVTWLHVTAVVNGDDLYEPDETFQISVSNVTGVDVGDSDGEITIHNAQDDAAPDLTISDAQIDEPELDGQSGDIVFTVSLSEASEATASFTWSTADDTATAPDDYEAQTSQTVTIQPGQTEALITVTAYGDNDDELDETF